MPFVQGSDSWGRDLRPWPPGPRDGSLIRLSFAARRGHVNRPAFVRNAGAGDVLRWNPAATDECLIINLSQQEFV